MEALDFEHEAAEILAWNQGCDASEGMDATMKALTSVYQRGAAAERERHAKVVAAARELADAIENWQRRKGALFTVTRALAALRAALDEQDKP